MRRLAISVLFTCLMASGLAACLQRGEAVLTPSPEKQSAVEATAASPTAAPAISPAAPQETATVPASTQPGPTPMSPALTQYQLTVVLSYDQHYLAVDERIHYTNRQTEPLPDLRLMVDPLYYPGAFTLKSITWGDGQPAVDYAVETGQIHISLPAPLQPGESLDLSLNYELRLPSPQPSAEVRPIPFGYTERQANFVDWYPFIPPYVPGKGWLAHQAGFFGEHLVYELADFKVDIRLTEDSPQLILAASAPATRDGEWYRYQHQSARNFTWSASTEYQVYSASVGNTIIQSYTFAYHSAAGQAVLATTAEALELYNQLYGDYPRALLSVVEADFLDGMEYDGLYFLSNGFYNLYQGTPGEYLVAISAHETAHQWFYASVANDQALEPWLDEALCTYQERIYYENRHPEALDWWWGYRVNYYQPRGWVNGSIYNPAGYRAYRDAVYLNGAMFLEELRNLIGDKDFFSFLSDYASKMRGQIATAEGFFTILGEHTDIDLTALIGKYFQSR